MQLFYAPDIVLEEQLPSEEAKHCIKILRHTVGDIIDVTDGKGSFYSCEILNTSKCALKIILTTTEKGSTRHRLHLAVAPTKNGERTDWMIEKLVEFGIDEITFLSCAHNERHKMNLERCNRIAISAMKQSLKATLPKINDLISFKEYISLTSTNNHNKYIAHCDATFSRQEINTTSASKNVNCCIGPEGDFSKQEIAYALENGFEGIALGDSRLRTETAAMAVCSYFYFN
ncbi:MAG: 16S rRNA (uracil(1498)-N(3))-methyltransferase [Bacteroidetes bacterium]|nr:16S rRNA (uracil(1498)-N(3))-methyltransferase [Bacteroidota bacterium]